MRRGNLEVIDVVKTEIAEFILNEASEILRFAQNDEADGAFDAKSDEKSDDQFPGGKGQDVAFFTRLCYRFIIKNLFQGGEPWNPSAIMSTSAPRRSPT